MERHRDMPSSIFEIISKSPSQCQCNDVQRQVCRLLFDVTFTHDGSWMTWTPLDGSMKLWHASYVPRFKKLENRVVSIEPVLLFTAASSCLFTRCLTAAVTA